MNVRIMIVGLLCLIELNASVSLNRVATALRNGFRGYHGQLAELGMPAERQVVGNLENVAIKEYPFARNQRLFNTKKELEKLAHDTVAEQNAIRVTELNQAVYKPVTVENPFSGLSYANLENVARRKNVFEYGDSIPEIDLQLARKKLGEKIRDSRIQTSKELAQLELNAAQRAHAAEIRRLVDATVAEKNAIRLVDSQRLRSKSNLFEDVPYDALKKVVDRKFSIDLPKNTQLVERKSNNMGAGASVSSEQVYNTLIAGGLGVVGGGTAKMLSDAQVTTPQDRIQKENEEHRRTNTKITDIISQYQARKAEAELAAQLADIDAMEKADTAFYAEHMKAADAYNNSWGKTYNDAKLLGSDWYNTGKSKTYNGVSSLGKTIIDYGTGFKNWVTK